MNNTVAILNTKPPFSTSCAKDSLDVALIHGSYEIETHLFFQGDGVWQLVNNQNAELINHKDILKTFSAFSFYDLDNVYICHDSLIERNLTLSFHIDDVQVLAKDEFNKKLHQHNVILNF